MRYSETIAEEGRQLEGHRNLISIKGIGPVRVSILRSVIGDINDLADEGELAAYFGIVQQVSKSNETERSGCVTKGGRGSPPESGPELMGAEVLNRFGVEETS